MKRFIVYALVPIMVLSFSLGFIKARFWKDFERWVIVEIKAQAWEHAEVRLDVESFGIRPFPLAVTLNKVTIHPPKAVRPFLAPILIDQVGANLSLWAALQGQFRVGTLDITHPQIRMIVKDKAIKKSTTSKEFDLFDLLRKTPISTLEIHELDWIGRVDSTNLVFKTPNLRLRLENNRDSLYAEIETDSFLLKPPGPRKGVELQTDIRFLLEPKRIILGALKVKHSESLVVGSGEANITPQFQVEQTLGSMRMKLNLNDLQEWLTVFYPAMQNVKGSGLLDLNVDVQTKKNAPTANIKLATKDIEVDGYKFGTWSGEGKLEDKKISVPEIKIVHPSGELQLREIEGSLADKKASFKLKTAFVNLPVLLDNIKVTDIPIKGTYSTDLPCDIKLEKDWQLICNGALHGENFELADGIKHPKTIVKFGSHRMEGQLIVDAQKVQYSAQLRIGQGSHGSSDGVISYENGFKINYKAEELLFTDVQNFVDLDFVGKAQLQGTTQGGSKSAVFQMDLNIDGFELEKYKLGQFNSHLEYTKSNLAFTNLKGQVGNSQYGGRLDILFDPMGIKMDINSPYMELKDLQEILSKTFPIPVALTGSGQMQIVGEGPLDFWKLNYDLKSQFFRGTIAGENFDQISAHLVAQNGRILTDNVFLKKGTGTIDVQGKIDTNKTIDAVLLGRKIALDQSEVLSTKGIQATGLVDFTLTLRGVLPDPTYDLNGRVSQTVLGGTALDDSQFHWSAQGKQGLLEAQLFGQQLLFSSTWKGEAWDQFDVKAKAKAWDFSPLLYLFSRPQAGYDLSTEIQGEVNLKSMGGGLWNSDGQIKIDKMALRRGSLEIENATPMLINVQKGHFQSQNFQINGTTGDQYLKLALNDLHQNHIDATMNGHMDLSFLGFTTPFLDELKGPFNLSLAWKGKAEDVRFSGSSFIEKGFVKINGIPHPISDIKADILFNNRDILINSIEAKMAGGTVNGDGKVSWLENKTFPMNFQAQFQKVTLNFPEGFRSQGSGQLNIKGSQFPLVMAIDYDITGGEITSDFSGTGGSSNIKSSPYLPKELIGARFEPFIYNIDLNILSSISVNNIYAKTPVRGRLKINGPLSNMLLTGTIQPQPGGKIFFRDQPFEVSTGFIEYDQDPPGNPKIYLTAFARVSEFTQDESQRQVRNDYDVNLLLQGRGVKPQIVLNSQPPLSQSDIVSLLALGVTKSSMDAGGSGRLAGGNTSTALGAAVLQKPIGKELKDRFGVELKVSSSQPSADTASVPKVTLSKQLSNKLGASASRTIGGTRQTSNVKLEFSVNRRTSVIGTWEGKEDDIAQEKDVNKSVFGLDLEYRINFK